LVAMIGGAYYLTSRREVSAAMHEAEAEVEAEGNEASDGPSASLAGDNLAISHESAA